jgi:cytochrome bd ubiquinol oxidase subunit I
MPDEKARENKFQISIPKLASLYLTHDINGEVKGLNDFKGVHPPVAPVFWGFRIMVGMGMLMLAVGWLAFWQQRRGGQIKPWLMKVLVGMTFSGWIATLAGWYVTEIGRQPWLVTGVLSTKQAAHARGHAGDVPHHVFDAARGLHFCAVLFGAKSWCT